MKPGLDLSLERAGIIDEPLEHRLGDAVHDRVAGVGGHEDPQRSLDVAGQDQILDFLDGDKDRINLADIDAIEGGIDNAFTFIGDDKFTKKAGELRYQVTGVNALVQGDVDGNGKADFAVLVINDNILVALDFVL